MVDRLLPHDIDAEESVIASLLIDNKAIEKIVNIIKSFDFYSERNRWIYEACLGLYNRREAINQISVAQELSRQEKLENCGGAAFLSLLISECATTVDVENYAGIVYRLSVSRKLIAFSEQLAGIGYNALPDANETINQASQLFDKFKQSNIVIGNKIITPLMAANSLFEMMESFGKVQTSIKWGFLDLDRMTTGIYPELIIIGARPSVGKTQLMIDIADYIETCENKKILFVSSEMTLRQLLERKVSKVLGKNIRELRANGMNDHEDERKILSLVGEMSEGTLNYMTEKVYAKDVYNAVSNLIKTYGLDIVFVDYLQFLADCWEDTRENQNIRVGKACKILKNIVTDFNIPVIVASQLNRGIEYRSKESKQPMLADLRDSGNIEQDADVVLLLHRDEVDDYTLSPILQIKMAKNRQLGTAPHIELVWNEELRRYVDCTKEEYQNA